MADDAKPVSGDSTIADADQVPAVKFSGILPKADQHFPVKEAAPEVSAVELAREQLRASLAGWFVALPPWLKAIVLFVVGGGLGTVVICCHQPHPVVNVSVPEPVVVTQPSFGARPEADRAYAGKRLFVKIMKNRLASQLQKDGFAMIGGDPKPLDSLAAWRLIGNLEDEVIVSACQQTGKLGDGSILERLGNLIQWISDHREEILQFIKILMALLAIFAADVAPM